VVEAAPAPALEVAKPELLLQLLEVALDPPPQLGGRDQLLDRGRTAYTEIVVAEREVSRGYSTAQQKLNFEMSVRNLLQSFEDRERVPKIQGLINECMTFTDDDLAAITGHYEDLLSIEEIVDQVFAADEKVLVFTHFATWGRRLAQQCQRIQRQGLLVGYGAGAGERFRTVDGGEPADGQ